MHPDLSALSPRLCACGADTGSPALDECERCESYDPSTSSPAEDDDMQPFNDQLACRDCDFTAQDDDFLVSDAPGYRGCPRCGSGNVYPADPADLRTRRAIRDMHVLAVTAHADAVREHNDAQEASDGK